MTTSTTIPPHTLDGFIELIRQGKFVPSRLDELLTELDPSELGLRLARERDHITTARGRFGSSIIDWCMFMCTEGHVEVLRHLLNAGFSMGQSYQNFRTGPEHGQPLEVIEEFAQLILSQCSDEEERRVVHSIIFFNVLEHALGTSKIMTLARPTLFNKMDAELFMVWSLVPEPVLYDEVYNLFCDRNGHLLEAHFAPLFLQLVIHLGAPIDSWPFEDETVPPEVMSVWCAHHGALPPGHPEVDYAEAEMAEYLLSEAYGTTYRAALYKNQKMVLLGFASPNSPFFRTATHTLYDPNVMGMIFEYLTGNKSRFVTRGTLSS